MADRKVEIAMALKDKVSARIKKLHSSFKTMGRVGKTAFKGVALGAKLAGRAVQKLSRLTAMMTRTVKRAAIAIGVGLVGAFIWATKKAMTQEDAIVGLTSTLKVLGQYSDRTIMKMKKFAAALQQQTKFGDEEILALMQQGLLLGIHTDKIEEATKAALALSKVSRRLRPEMAMRYYARTLIGDYGPLEEYLVPLKAAKNKGAELERILKVLFDAVKTDASVASGSIVQMFNAIGDAAESFGRPFLRDIVESAKRVKKWAEDNQFAIEKFAISAQEHLSAVKDIIGNFLTSGDSWGQKWHTIWDAFLEIMKGALKSSVVLAAAAGEGIWRGITKRGGKKRVIEKTVTAMKVRDIYPNEQWRDAETGQRVGNRLEDWQRRYHEKDRETFDMFAAFYQKQETERMLKPILTPAFAQIEQIRIDTLKKAGGKFGQLSGGRVGRYASWRQKEAEYNIESRIDVLLRRRAESEKDIQETTEKTLQAKQEIFRLENVSKSAKTKYFAMSPIERYQTRYLLEKLHKGGPDILGTLSQSEREDVVGVDVLREYAGEAIDKFTSQQLGIATKSQNQKVEIGLTDKAKKWFEIRSSYGGNSNAVLEGAIARMSVGN